MEKSRNANDSRRQPPKAAGARGFSTVSGGGKPQKLKQATLFETLHEIDRKEAAQKKTTIVTTGERKTGLSQRVAKMAQPEKSGGAAAQKSEKANKLATGLMKMVASKAYDPRKAKKTFSEQEMKELRWIGQENETKEDRIEVREEYRRIKMRVKELEAGNNSRLIVFPSLVTGEGWYKVVEFSALYYVYRLADRMGRIAHIMKDSDRYLKCYYTASITNIER